MKLNKEFIVFDAGQESMLVPTGAAKFAGLVRGNKMLGVILELLKKDTTEKEVVETICERYDGPREVIEADVKKAVSELRRIGALEG